MCVLSCDTGSGPWKCLKVWATALSPGRLKALNLTLPLIRAVSQLIPRAPSVRGLAVEHQVLKLAWSVSVMLMASQVRGPGGCRQVGDLLKGSTVTASSMASLPADHLCREESWRGRLRLGRPSFLQLRLKALFLISCCCQL